MNDDELTTQGEGENPDAVKIGAMLNKQNASDIADAVANINSSVDRLMQVLQRAGVDISAMSGKSIDNAALDALAGGKLLATNTTAVKALGNGRVGGYLVMYGSPAQKDLQGEYFTPETKLGLDLYPTRPALYHHGLDGAFEATKIGDIDTLTEDEIGVWAEAQLDMRKKYVQAVYQLVEKGALGWSSGSIPHLVKIAAGGRIEEWPIVEGSLTPTPAEPRIVVSTLKAAHAIVFEEAEQLKETPAPAAVDVSQIVSRISVKGHKSMDMQPMVASVLDALLAAFGESAPQLDDTQKQQIVAQVVSQLGAMESAAAMTPEQAKAQGEQVAQAVIKALGAFTNPRAVQNAAIEAVKGAIANAEPQSKVPGGHNGGNHQVKVSEPLKYEHLSLDDMLFGHKVIKSWNNGYSRVSDEYLQILSGRVENELRKQDSPLQSTAVKSLIKGTKANEIATSTASGGGDEWVSVAYDRTIWEKVRGVRIYQDLIKKGMREVEVPKGAESTIVATEGADPTVYTLSQNADLGADSRPAVVVNTTRIGTGQKTLTPGWLGMAVAYTTVLDEDNFINVLPQFRGQVEEKAQETIEQLMINGDTATGANTNINLIDGTPGTGLSKPYYLASDGFLKYALVTGSSTSRDGGALDENDYRLTLKLLATEFRTRFKNLAFIIDGDTHSASLDIAALKTDDVKRTNATISSGVIANMYGVDVFVSSFMPLANSAGKVPAAGGTLGRILAIYAPYWVFGYKRQITIETQRAALDQATVMVATFRLGFVARGAGASTVSYNLTV